MTVAVDWSQWHLETLNALEDAVINSSVSWGTKPGGEAWVVVGDSTPSGITYPAAFIPEFTSDRDPGESDKGTELREISATVWVIVENDVKQQEANLRDAVETGGEVLNGLYDDRTLSDTCDNLDGDSMEAGAAVVDGENVAVVDLSLTITKQATIYEQNLRDTA